MGRPPISNGKTAFITLRITPTTDQLWEDTAKALGLSKVACMEMAIRKLARAEGIAERPIEEKPQASGV